MNRMPLPNPYKPGGPLLPPKQKTPSPAPTPTSKKKTKRRHRGKKRLPANTLSPVESAENKHEITAAIDDEISGLESVIDDNKATIILLEIENEKFQHKIEVLQRRKAEIIGTIHKLNTNFGTI